MFNLFAPFDPSEEKNRPVRRLARVPIRAIIPNMVTLLSLASGLTALRLTLEGRYELAIYAIFAAALLDGLDGRIARYLRATSRFGAELDSLADFVSFAVAPALLLFGWILENLRSFGWLAALLFASAGALRLARFNAEADRIKPAWQTNFFTGVPAPAGAMVALLPLYLEKSGLPIPVETAPLILLYTVFVALLMVSRIPTVAVRKFGRIRRDHVLPLLVGLVFAAGMLASFTFETLSVLVLGYFATIPLSWRHWNRLARLHDAREEEIGFDSAYPETEKGPDSKPPPA